MTFNFKIIEMFIELTSNIGFNNSNFIDVNEELSISDSTLTNFFAIFITISIDFDNFDFDNAVEMSSINNLISTNFVIFKITIIDIIIFIEDCLFFNVINNNFCK